MTVGRLASGWKLQTTTGKEYSLADFVGRPLLLIVGDRDAQPASQAWGEQVARQYGDRLQMVGVADLRQAPRWMRGIITRAIETGLRRSEMGSFPLLLDWKGILAEDYQLEGAGPFLVLVNAAGTIVFVTSGLPSKDTFENLAIELNRMWRQENSLAERI